MWSLLTISFTGLKSRGCVDDCSVHGECVVRWHGGGDGDGVFRIKMAVQL
jgi:hypothetical protein